MDAVLEAVASENRTDLTAEETAKVDALVAESRSLDEKIEKLTHKQQPMQRPQKLVPQ
jgi:hypothetical protein